LFNATNATLVLANAQPIHAGDYRAVIANMGGSVTSAVAALAVLTAPTILSAPHSQTVIAGGSAVLEVIAESTSPIAFQWRQNNDVLTDETNATLVLTDVQPDDTGTYSVTVSNLAGSATSAATLTVLSPPEIIAAPQPQRVIDGSNVTFVVSAVGSPPLTYQWRFKSISISGGTNATLLLPNVRAADAGNYDVTISNPAGSTTSESAALTISLRPWLAWLRLSNDAPQFILSGTPGDRYAIEFSTNFVDWAPASMVTNVSGIILLDAPLPNASQTYFRGRLLPQPDFAH
jgi:hypothetical protein